MCGADQPRRHLQGVGHPSDGSRAPELDLDRDKGPNRGGREHFEPIGQNREWRQTELGGVCERFGDQLGGGPVTPDPVPPRVLWVGLEG